jgi:hypothetical protein
MPKKNKLNELYSILRLYRYFSRFLEERALHLIHVKTVWRVLRLRIETASKYGG